MSTLIKLRRDTAANWAATDPVLSLGEPGYDTTNNELRIGDGTSVWSSLTPIAGGGGGASLPLANGSSNFNIASAGGNATIVTDGTNTWTFDTNAQFTAPGDIRTGNVGTDGRFIQDCGDGTTSMRWVNIGIEDDAQLIRAYSGDPAVGNSVERGQIAMDWTSANVSGITIQSFDQTPGSEATYEWQFRGTGILNLPNSGVINTAGNSVDIGSNDSISLEANTVVNIYTDTNGTAYQWQFGDAGELTLPSSSEIKEVANPGGFPGYALSLVPDPNNAIDADQQLLVYPTGGVDANHLHVTSGNLYNTELFLGNDNLYVKLANTGNVVINSNDNVGNTAQWTFGTTGSVLFPTLTVNLHNGGNQNAQTLQFSDPDQQVIITGPTPAVDNNAQRIIIQGQAGNGAGEGGDVYLWGGDAEFNGGDIKIYAGNADNVASGSGGYVNIEGGSGFDNGGYVSMQGGQSNNGQGAYAQLVGGYGVSGGDANITGGQGYAGTGGAVNHTGGASGNGLAEYGNVNIGAGASTWSFDNTGNLTIPAGGAIQTAPGSSGNILIHPDDGASIIMQGGAATLLTISSDVANVSNKIEIDTYGDQSTLGGAFIGRFARGTPGSYTNVIQDDRLAVFGGLGYGSSGFSNSARGRITIDAAETWSDAAQGTHVSVWTTALGTNTPAESARFGAGANFVLYAGNVTVGNGYVRTQQVLVANLPTPLSGARSFVTDADTRVWGNVAVGGAGNAVPVWADGSAWYIG